MQDGEEEGKEEFAIVFAAMGVNMETAHYFKQVGRTTPCAVAFFRQHLAEAVKGAASLDRLRSNKCCTGSLVPFA